MPLGVERSSQPNAVIPPNSFLLWQILLPRQRQRLDMSAKSDQWQHHCFDGNNK
jgi:hypothetical protein